MTFSAKHLTAIHRLVAARVAAGGQTADWQELLAAVEAERIGRVANDTAAPLAAGANDLGELVFAIDLPLQVEKPRTKPRILKGKALAKALKEGASPIDWSPVVTILCPTMNTHKGMRTFARQVARKELDQRIAAERLRWPRSPWGGVRVGQTKKKRGTPVGGRRRFVRVTRFSSRRPDELAVDVLGGKLPVDRLVEAGVLGDDNDAWCAREGRWEQAKTGEGFLRVEVFELEGEAGVPRAGASKKRARRTP